MTLIPDWKVEFHRLWSLRVGLFFFALTGFLAGLAAFGEILNPFLYMGLSVFGYGLMGAMRLLKQAPAVPTEPSTELPEAKV